MILKILFTLCITTSAIAQTSPEMQIAIMGKQLVQEKLVVTQLESRLELAQQELENAVHSRNHSLVIAVPIGLVSLLIGYSGYRGITLSSGGGLASLIGTGYGVLASALALAGITTSVRLVYLEQRQLERLSLLVNQLLEQTVLAYNQLESDIEDVCNLTRLNHMAFNYCH